MSKAGNFKISNGKTVKKWHALFRVEGTNPPLRNEKRKLPHFLVTNWNITKAMHKYGQENIDALQRHMIHMYIHDTLIPKIS